MKINGEKIKCDSPRKEGEKKTIVRPQGNFRPESSY